MNIETEIYVLLTEYIILARLIQELKIYPLYIFLYFKALIFKF